MADDNDKPLLTRRRVLGGLTTVGVAGAVGSGTYALFSDTETLPDNVLEAGELDLIIDYTYSFDQGDATPNNHSGTGLIDGNESDFSFSVDDIKPGDSGKLAFCPKIVNNPAYLWIGSDDGLTDNENGQNEPEGNPDESNDTTAGDDTGELSENVNVTVSLASDVSIVEGEVSCETIRQLHNEEDYTLADLGHDLQDGFLIEPDPATGTDVPYPASSGPNDQEGPCLCIEFSVPDDVGNEIQGDSIDLPLSFEAVQSRHNDDPDNPFGGGM